jgi:hypothetical protein
MELRACRLLKATAEAALVDRTAKGFAMTRRLMVVGVLLASAAAASAQDSYRHGRVLSVEPGVTLQRATEPGAEEAFPNLPFLPGDRVWSDRAGRAEFQFADGTVLRLDSASKLDYVAHDDGGGDRVVLRLWSGGLYLHNRDGRGYPDFGIETPAGVVEARVRGVYRVDVEAGETRLSVYEGEASLDAEREVRVAAGERAYARQGQPTDDPRGFERAEVDDFDRWDTDREDRQAYASNRREYLPETVLPYAGELDTYGAWYYQSEIGHVWRPYVAAGWRPYFDGRWVWTVYGWTWVPNESWGWAPFHYGRWDYTPMLGWYWIPGNAWGPAWVSWAVGPDYVGWCPLGHRDRRVVFGGRRLERGHAVPRSNAATGSEAWAYVSRAEFGASDLAKKIENAVPAGHEVHAIEQVHARPGHDLASVEVGTRPVAAPRNVRTRFGPGDTTPELRTDPMTTIPFPVARRRHRDTEDEGGARPSLRAGTPEPAAPAAEPVHPTDTRPHPTDLRPHRVTVPAAPTTPTPAARERDGRDGAAHPTDGDREVLRRVFGPLSQPRPADGAERPARSRPAGEGSRPAPPAAHAEPHAPPPSAPESHGAAAPRGQAGGRPESSGNGHAQRPATKDKDH